MKTRKFRPFDVFIVAVLAAAAVFCLVSVAVRVVAPGPFEVKKHRNLAYYTGDDAVGTKHTLDVYQPEGARDATVLLFVHGGSWKFGSKLLRTNVGNTFARRGIVTVCINYRLSPAVKHPAHIRDVARAFDWVKRNIHPYGGNPECVILSGHSAGGHLVSLLALNERYLKEVGRGTDEIAAVIPVSGVYRVGATGPFFKDVFDPDPDTLRDASPVVHVDERQPPFLIIYGDDELPGLDTLAIGFADRLRQHNSPAKLVRVENRSHLSIVRKIGEHDDPTTQAMLTFINEHSGPGRN